MRHSGAATDIGRGIFRAEGSAIGVRDKPRFGDGSALTPAWERLICTSTDQAAGSAVKADSASRIMVYIDARTCHAEGNGIVKCIKVGTQRWEFEIGRPIRLRTGGIGEGSAYMCEEKGRTGCVAWVSLLSKERGVAASCS